MVKVYRCHDENFILECCYYLSYVASCLPSQDKESFEEAGKIANEKLASRYPNFAFFRFENRGDYFLEFVVYTKNPCHESEISNSLMFPMHHSTLYFPVTKSYSTLRSLLRA